MDGLEPRDIHWRHVGLDFAKAHERVGLVDLAVDRLRHLSNARDVGIASDAHEARLAHDAPQQTVKQCEAPRIRMQNRTLGHPDESTRHLQLEPCRGVRLVWACPEQTAAVADRPFDLVGWNAVCDQRTRGITPGREVDL
jgi:hypothetical protein